MKKKFLISIDTEGDNLWAWKPGDSINTENAKYLPRFQELCDQYGFKPTYLTNYEMACDDYFVEFAKNTMQENRCEIGMHLHAWNSPPAYELEVRSDVEPGAPYLIEYSEEIMDEKICYMTNLLKERFGILPVTHRAGRWAMNRTYFRLLEKHGYKYDCSVTPGKSWSHAPGQSNGSFGSDYLRASLYPYTVNGSNIVEIPVTVREDHRLRKNPGEGIRKQVRNQYRALKGQGKIWLRPNGHNLEDMMYLTNVVSRNRKDDYLMFMLHSSELMPGSNPRFTTNESIEKLYSDLNVLFWHIAKEYKGATIGEYGTSICKKR